jgi:hypothetical protein
MRRSRMSDASSLQSDRGHWTITLTMILMATLMVTVILTETLEISRTGERRGKFVAGDDEIGEDVQSDIDGDIGNDELLNDSPNSG